MLPPIGADVAAGEHRLSLRIYYADTDAGGVVYHANYLRFFEAARLEMMEACGMDLLSAAARGEGTYVVTEAALRYRMPARLGDRLVVATRVGGIRRVGVVVHQRVMRDGDVLVEGRIALALVGVDGRPRRQPADWIRAFEALAQGASPPA